MLRAWLAAAERRSMLRDLLGTAQRAAAVRTTRACFAAWHDRLARRVAARVKQLSALLHWEQGLQRRALGLWLQRTDGWRWK